MRSGTPSGTFGFSSRASPIMRSSCSTRTAGCRAGIRAPSGSRAIRRMRSSVSISAVSTRPKTAPPGSPSARSVPRGASLTKQLLAFARAQPLEIRSIDLKSFLDDVTMLIRPSLRSNIEVMIESSDQLWNVDADAGALELALLNLAFNARDAMKDGGTLKISATNQLLEGKPEGLRGKH